MNLIVADCYQCDGDEILYDYCATYPEHVSVWYGEIDVWCSLNGHNLAPQGQRSPHMPSVLTLCKDTIWCASRSGSRRHGNGADGPPCGAFPWQLEERLTHHENVGDWYLRVLVMNVSLMDFLFSVLFLKMEFDQDGKKHVLVNGTDMIVPWCSNHDDDFIFICGEDECDFIAEFTVYTAGEFVDGFGIRCALGAVHGPIIGNGLTHSVYTESCPKNGGFSEFNGFAGTLVNFCICFFRLLFFAR